jgi:hypothetical protein
MARQQRLHAPPNRAVIALFAIALVLRVFWVPFHLAVERHGPSPGNHAAGHHEHHDDEEPFPSESDDGEHAPHSAADHLTAIVAPRTLQGLGWDTLAPPEEAFALPTVAARTVVSPQRSAPVPGQTTLPSTQARAPPPA